MALQAKSKILAAGKKTPTAQKPQVKSQAKSQAKSQVKPKPTADDKKVAALALASPTEQVIASLTPAQLQALEDFATEPLAFAEEFLTSPADPTKKFRANWMQVPLLKLHGQRFNTVRAQRGCGKLLDVATKVPTPTGWTTMGTIDVGDTIFDENGKPCHVTFISDIEHEHQCYTLTFDDGVTIVAGPEHQWFVHTRASRRAAAASKNPQILPKVVTTAEMLDDLYVGPAQHLEVNYSIDITGPLECPEVSLPLAPYTLGAWLGDGTSRCAQITSADSEVLENIEADGYAVSEGSVDKRGNKSKCYVIGDKVKGKRVISTILADLELLQNKHIPLSYQRASIHQRTELLKGLMDTDGHVSKGGRCEYTSTSKQLAQDVHHLILGLGFKATLTTGRATCGGKDCGEKYRILFTPHTPVFKLARKLIRQHAGKSQRAVTHRRYITSITETTPRSLRCIQVDSPNHLYLAGEECVVTHNTVAVMALILWFAFSYRDKDVLIIGPYKMTVQRVFEELLRQIEASPMLASCVVRKRMNPMEIKFMNGTLIRGQSTNVTSKRAGQATRGEHPDFVYIDEADYLDDADWTAFQALFDPPHEDVMPPVVYATTTPTGKRSKFYFLCEDKGPGGMGEDWKDWWFPARHIEDVTFRGPYTVDPQTGYLNPTKDAEILCSKVNPKWSAAADKRQRAMNGEQGYLHEIIAWWGESAYSVFPKELIEKAKARGTAGKFTYHWGWVKGVQQFSGFYTLGVDIDQMQATPNLCIVEYVPPSKDKLSGGTYIVRFRESMPRSAYLLHATKLRVAELANTFQLTAAYVDKTPGQFMVEELNVEGHLQVQGKSFRENEPFVNPATNEVEQKSLKHVMIAFAQWLFEEGRIIIPPRQAEIDHIVVDHKGNEKLVRGPDWDDEFITQLINYQVIKVTKTGVPEYTSKDEHAIDAFLLALYAAIRSFDHPYDYQFTNQVGSHASVDETNLFGGKGAIVMGVPEKRETHEPRYEEMPADPEEIRRRHALKHPQRMGGGRSFTLGNSGEPASGRSSF